MSLSLSSWKIHMRLWPQKSVLGIWMSVQPSRKNVSFQKSTEVPNVASNLEKSQQEGHMILLINEPTDSKRSV